MRQTNQSACGLSTGLSSLVVGRVQYVRYQYRYRNLVRIRTRTPTYDTFIRKVDFGESSAFKIWYTGTYACIRKHTLYPRTNSLFRTPGMLW